MDSSRSSPHARGAATEMSHRLVTIAVLLAYRSSRPARRSPHHRAAPFYRSSPRSAFLGSTISRQDPSQCLSSAKMHLARMSGSSITTASRTQSPAIGTSPTASGKSKRGEQTFTPLRGPLKAVVNARKLTPFQHLNIDPPFIQDLGAAVGVLIHPSGFNVPRARRSPETRRSRALTAGPRGGGRARERAVLPRVWSRVASRSFILGHPGRPFFAASARSSPIRPDLDP
jgi:hypothetical protein